MNSLPLVHTGALLTVSVLAAGWDLRTARIPNRLVATGFAAALVLQGVAGIRPFLGGLEGAALVLALFVPLFAVGAMGGGDVKLLVVVAAFLGPERLLPALLVMGITGGAMALAAAWRRGALLPVMFGSGEVIRHWATPAQMRGTAAPIASGGITIPYGVAIALGAAAACLV